MKWTRSEIGRLLPILEQVSGRAGLVQAGPHSLSRAANSWWRDAEPALQAVMQAVFASLPPVTGGRPDEIAAVGAFIDRWIERDETDWDSPLPDDRGAHVSLHSLNYRA
jgi:hypothetical protein